MIILFLISLPYFFSHINLDIISLLISVHTSFESNDLIILSFTSLMKVNNKECSIVVWGTNLSSSIGLGRFSKQENRIILLSPYCYSLTVGLLLSDAGLQKGKPHWNAQLVFKQSLSSFKYFWKVFMDLSHYCSSMPHLDIGKRSGITTFGIRFFTRRLPCITELHSLFYKNNKKVIPDDIYNLLDPVALAHWIQGDGAFSTSGLVFCTDSFSIQDTVRLMNVLIIRYNLDCTLRKAKENQYRIYVRANSMANLCTLVLPYLDPSMYYKLGKYIPSDLMNSLQCP